MITIDSIPVSCVLCKENLHKIGYRNTTTHSMDVFECSNGDCDNHYNEILTMYDSNTGKFVYVSSLPVTSMREFQYCI